MMQPVQFETRIGQGGQGDGSTSFILVPPEVVEALGKGRRPPVRVTINGHTYRSTVAVYGGEFYLPVRRGVREAADVTHGQPVTVGIELDDAPREVVVPDDLGAALGQVRSAFDGLSYSHRKEYVDWIEGARRADTRRSRIEKAVEMLRAGIRTPKG